MKKVEVDVLGYAVAVEGLTLAAEATLVDADAIMTIVLALVKKGVLWCNGSIFRCASSWKSGQMAKWTSLSLAPTWPLFLDGCSVQDVSLTLTWLLTSCGEGEGGESAHDLPTISWTEFATFGLLAHWTYLIHLSWIRNVSPKGSWTPNSFISQFFFIEWNAWMTKYALQKLLGLQKALLVIRLSNTVCPWNSSTFSAAEFENTDNLDWLIFNKPLVWKYVSACLSKNGSLITLWSGRTNWW